MPSKAPPKILLVLIFMLLSTAALGAYLELKQNGFLGGHPILTNLLSGAIGFAGTSIFVALFLNSIAARFRVSARSERIKYFVARYHSEFHGLCRPLPADLREIIGPDRLIADDFEFEVNGEPLRAADGSVVPTADILNHVGTPRPSDYAKPAKFEEAYRTFWRARFAEFCESCRETIATMHRIADLVELDNEPFLVATDSALDGVHKAKSMSDSYNGRSHARIMAEYVTGILRDLKEADAILGDHRVVRAVPRPRPAKMSEVGVFVIAPHGLNMRTSAADNRG